MNLKRKGRAAAGGWWIALLAATLVPASQADAETPAYVGDETCLECHDGLGTAFARTIHGRLDDHRYPGEGRGCESCHGPGSVHAESGGEDLDAIVRFGGSGGAGACLECHVTGRTMNWDDGAHAAADVACTDCHGIHASAAGTAQLAAPETELCLGCHQEVRAQLHLPSHHPVREGFVGCTDCHDVHGPGFAGIGEAEMARELCLDCHAQHRGPFIFEHSPVEEDCGICHAPHGAVANNLLLQNEPFICLQCHQPHFHSGLMAYDGAFPDGTPPGTPAEEFGLSGVSHPDSFKRVMMTKCTQCHQSVHGTDLPSQSIPGQGRALNR